MSVQQQRVPGVLGGMGPAATLDFLQRLLDAVPAVQDQDHLRVLVDHHPGVPNRHAAIAAAAAGAQEPVSPVLAQMARGLAAAGADFLVMPCNTAHAFAPTIRAATPLPLLDIIEVVVRALPQHCTVPGPVGVMAASGCYASGLYPRALSAAGYEVLLWDSAEQDAFMQCVYRIKAAERGEALRQQVLQLAQQLCARGARALISGCTEIPLVLSAADVPVPLLDSTALLAAATVAAATGDWPL